MSNLDKVIDYIGKTKYLILRGERTKDFPGLITLLSFANDGFQVYFQPEALLKRFKKWRPIHQSSSRFNMMDRNYVRFKV